MDVLGRPTLLQVHNTAEQAISDVRVLAQDLEGLMDFLLMVICQQFMGQKQAARSEAIADTGQNFSFARS
jgi:hypothetical protein